MVLTKYYPFVWENMYKMPKQMISTSKQVLLLVKMADRKWEGRFYLYVPQVSFGHGTALVR